MQALKHRINKTSTCLEVLDFVDFDIHLGPPEGPCWVYLEVLGGHFGVILVIKWGTGALRGALNGSMVDFH